MGLSKIIRVKTRIGPNDNNLRPDIVVPVGIDLVVLGYAPDETECLCLASSPLNQVNLGDIIVANKHALDITSRTQADALLEQWGDDSVEEWSGKPRKISVDAEGKSAKNVNDKVAEKFIAKGLIQWVRKDKTLEDESDA